MHIGTEHGTLERYNLFARKDNYHVERHRGGFVAEHEARDLDGQWWSTLKEAQAAAEARQRGARTAAAERVGDCRVREFRARAASGDAAG